MLIPLLELDFDLATPDGTRLRDALARLPLDEGVRRAGDRARRPDGAGSRIRRGSDAQRDVAGEVGEQLQRQLAGGPGLDERAQIGERHQQAQARRDLQVGGVGLLAAE